MFSVKIIKKKLDRNDKLVSQKNHKSKFGYSVDGLSMYNKSSKSMCMLNDATYG